MSTNQLYSCGKEVRNYAHSNFKTNKPVICLPKELRSILSYSHAIIISNSVVVIFYNICNK
jgi:hypothetical protein